MSLSFARGRVVVIAIVIGIVGCGNVFRPVVNPLLSPGGTPAPNRLAFVLSSTGVGAPGVSTAIDVSGDTDVAEFNTGRGPSYETFNNTSLYIADQFDSTVTAATGFIAIGSVPITPIVTRIALPAGVLGPPNPSPCPNPTATARANPMIAVGNYLYVAESTRSVLAAASTMSNSFVSEIPVSSVPVSLLFVPAVSKIYSLNSPTGDLTSILADSNAVATASIKVGNCPVYAVANLAGTRLFVANQSDGTLSVVDTSNDQVSQRIPVGQLPVSLTVNAQKNELLVANEGSGTVSIVEIDTSLPNPNFGSVTTLKVGGSPAYVVNSPDGTRAYVMNIAPDANGNGSVDVLDTVNNALLGTLSTGKGPISMAQSNDGSKVYVLNQVDSSVTIIATQPNSITGLANAVVTLPVPRVGTASPFQIIVQP